MLDLGESVCSQRPSCEVPERLLRDVVAQALEVGPATSDIAHHVIKRVFILNC
jgi:hypothetical protein